MQVDIKSHSTFPVRNVKEPRVTKMRGGDFRVDAEEVNKIAYWLFVCSFGALVIYWSLRRCC